MKNTVGIILTLILLYGCSQANDKVTDQHEQLFKSTSDSLKFYLNTSYIKNVNDSSLTDYSKLEFSSFKSKYKLNDIEMDDLAAQLKLTIEIAKTSNRIDDNITRTKTNVGELKFNNTDSINKHEKNDSLLLNIMNSAIDANHEK